MNQYPSRIDIPQHSMNRTMPRFTTVICEFLRRVLPSRRILPRLMMWSLPVVVAASPSWSISRRLLASEINGRRASPDSTLLRETRLTLKARQALSEDSLLAPYNIGVIVRGEVATLQGTLPTTALALRAQERVRGLQLFKEVRSAVSIDLNCDLPTQMPILSSPSSVPPIVKPRPTGALTGRGNVPSQVPVLKITVPDETGGPVSPAVDPVMEKPPLSDAVTLLPPRPIPDVKNNPSDPPAMNPADAVEALRRSDKRFQPLQVSVRDGVVTVRGTGDDLFAFAQAVRRVPGVLRVVVEPTSR
jgi:hypothetical protein